MENSCQQPTLHLVVPLRQMDQSPEGSPEGPHQHLGQGDPARYKQPLSVEPEGHGPCTSEGSLFPGLACPLSNRQFYLWTSFPGVRWQSHLFWMLWRWELDPQRADALFYFWTQRKQKGRGIICCIYFQCFYIGLREVGDSPQIPHWHTPVLCSNEVSCPQHMVQPKTYSENLKELQ